jgi:DtxR family Mn-dependent transcriptional regulator
VSLSRLQPGQTGSICSVEANSKVTQRLADLGLTPDTSILVVKTVPFDGPVEVAVRGSRLAVGKDIARCILVKMNEG